jgi:hypothetical protein
MEAQDLRRAPACSITWGRLLLHDQVGAILQPSHDRADAMAIAFAGRANAAPMNVESHAWRKHHRGFDDEGVVSQGGSSI